VRNNQPDITKFQNVVISNEEAPPELQVSSIYGNHNPLEVDIGSGKGRFLLARANGHPTTNYLGIERQLGRVYRAAKKATHLNIENVKLCRVEAMVGLSAILPNESVTTFYIFFPDPWPKRRHLQRRLVSPPFLDLLHSKLIPKGCIHFATDHQDYADVVGERFAADARFKSTTAFQPTEDERTDFELIFTGQNKTISRYSIQKRQA